MHRSHQKVYHSDSIITQLLLGANEYLHHDDPVIMDAIVKGSKTTSINWDRTLYFEFAYSVLLAPATILIWPAIIISTISMVVKPYMFNMMSCVLYALFGVIAGLSTMLYNKQEESKMVDYSKTPEYSVFFSKKDLWRSGIMGGLSGISFAILFYWFGIWLHLHPRGSGG